MKPRVKKKKEPKNASSSPSMCGMVYGRGKLKDVAFFARPSPVAWGGRACGVILRNNSHHAALCRLCAQTFDYYVCPRSLGRAKRQGGRVSFEETGE